VKTSCVSLRPHRQAIAIAITIAVGFSPALAQVASKGPEPATLKANAELAKTLPFANRQDFDDAIRGFVGTMPDALVSGTGPRPVWSMKPYDFLKQSEPADSVNPSLWRQAHVATSMPAWARR
jgi:alkyl sulfatase BDS1-like metallo-beta-lactamase superfamily hydrolase